MKHSDAFVKVRGAAVALVLAAGFVTGCSTSTEPTVQLNFPEGMKIPQPAPTSTPVPGTGVTSQGDPRVLSK
jgi:hypothetical protein